MNRFARRAALALLLSCMALTAQAQVVVSQVYGGGGNSGATLKSDFIELHNNGTTAVDLTGWSVQYASSTGNTWQTTPLSGSIPAGGYYLVKQADGAGGSVDLPVPDAVGTIAMGAGAGKVALVFGTTPLSGSCPSTEIDFVPYGFATQCAAPTPTLGATLAARRFDGGCVDTDNAALDFEAVAPSPRNGASTTFVCDISGTPPNLTITDVSGNEGDSGTTTFTFTVNLSRPAGEDGVSFVYRTNGGTASAGSDFQAQLSQLNMPYGATSARLFISVLGDTLEEADEQFTLTIDADSVQGATLVDGTGVGTIVNDDNILPGVSISDTGAVEGDAGTKAFLFTLSLDAPAGAGGVAIDYATTDGTATAGSDYVAKTDTATIAQGATSVTIGIDVVGDTATEPNETFFVDITGATGATIADAQGVGTIDNDDVAIVPIHDIQGTTDTSPLLGLEVSTRGIVTGRKSNGFFLQAPDAEADADPATSEGIFVFTGSAPPGTAEIGNEVIVTGTVAEFLPAADPGQLNLTELVSPEVVFVSAGNALPAPVVLTPAFPSPAGPLDQLERVEGMRVTAESFTVVAATGGNVSETNATSSSNGQLNLVVTGTPRPFREPGIQAPDPAPGGGSIPPIPRWDFNPELLFSDTDALGGTRYDLSVGATLENYVGPLDYGFRRYSVHQDPTVSPMVTQGPGWWSARGAGVDEFTYATYNLQRFFDDVNDPSIGEPVLTVAAFDLRLGKASLGIRDFMRAPDILGVVEVENLATLQALAARINADAIAAGEPDPQYVAYLLEGNDVGGIDVGYLVKTAEVSAGTPRVEVVGAPLQLGKDLTWNDPVNGPGTLLNDRPPLLLDAIVHFADGRQFPITVIVVHQRSLNGAEDDDVGGDRTRTKRQLQAEFLADQIETMQLADPQRRIAVAGDFNAFEFNDGLTDVLGAVTGMPSADEETAVAGDGADLVTDDLLNLYIEEPVNQRYSFEFGGNAQSLDHVLINQALGAAAASVHLDHARINADFPESMRGNPLIAARLSDHDPTIAYINLTSADLRMEAETITTIVAPGGQIEFQATIGNLGPDAANFPGLGVAVDAELPDLAVVAPAGWTCDPPAVSPVTTIACASGSLDADASAPFSITATAPAGASGTSIAMTASAHAQTFDPVLANDSATVEALVEALVEDGADLAVDIDGPDTATGVPFVEYAIAVSNLGNEAAMGSELHVEVSSRSLTSSLAIASGWRCNRELLAAATRFTCRAGSNVPVAGEAVFRLKTQTRAFRGAGSIEVQAIVASASSDTNLANNQDFQETLLQ